MKIKFSLPIVLIMLICIFVFFVSLSRADVDKVKICGNVRGEYNKAGLLYITLNKVINNREALEPAVVSQIDSSGEYCIEAPMGIGEVNITAFNPLKTTSILVKYKVPFAVYPDTLSINDEDISGVDIEFKSGGESAGPMKKYSGSTVTVSGKVFMPDYKDGHIGITANVGEPGPPGVGIVTIEKPGEYSLSIPAGFGEIYIAANNIQKDRSQHFGGSYSNNPILVGNEDIKGIDIIIQ